MDYIQAARLGRPYSNPTSFQLLYKPIKAKRYYYKMAEEDIYKNKTKYERFKANLKSLIHRPSKSSRAIYYCKNPANLKHFEKLFLDFEAKDLSYIRRNRTLDSMKLIVYTTVKNLSECDRDDINKIVAFMHQRYKSLDGKKSFIKDIKYMWKILFPENDEKGRPDETIVPYPVRHLSGKIDISKKKLRKDKLNWDEFERIINYFSSDPRIQAYLTLQLESLARPQELLYRRICEIEHFNSYAKISLSDHGKEGPGFLQCIDSYPYLLKWLEKHPQKNDKEAFIFINTGNRNTLCQLTPYNINKMLRKACKDLSIKKPITCYSLKRSGVSLRRLRGESDVEIQHAARWTSTKQLNTYDLTDQNDVLKLSLQKRGLLPSDKELTAPESKTCAFCGEVAGFAEIICPKCKHPLERNLILDEKRKDEEIHSLKMTIQNFSTQFEKLKKEIMKDLSKKIMDEIDSKKRFEIMNN